jgi:hypothetical protein
VVSGNSSRRKQFKITLGEFANCRFAGARTEKAGTTNATRCFCLTMPLLFAHTESFVHHEFDYSTSWLLPRSLAGPFHQRAVRLISMLRAVSHSASSVFN